jgi:hypothetical protein
MDQKSAPEERLMEKKSKAKKGFLEDKYYHPDRIKDQDSDETTADLKEEAQYSISPEKAPRPDVEPEPEKEKERKAAQKRHILPKTKDAELKRAYTLRYVLIAIGIVILIISLGISYLNFINLSDGQASLEETGYELMTDLRDYEGLKLEPEQGMPAWEANKVLALTSDDISKDLKPEVEYLIEIEDLSSFNFKYNRTLENQLAWGSIDLSLGTYKAPEDTFEISMLMDIYVSSQEVHLARVTVTVWE